MSFPIFLKLIAWTGWFTSVFPEKNDCVAVQIKSLKYYYVTVIVSFKMNTECLWDGWSIVV